ncbi:MAG: DUF2231 domain-containing protein [Hyphomonadaceae bacterium]
MKPHPVHPMLVHVPIACWILTPFCDAVALAFHIDFFWQAAALVAAIGVMAGALAATAGAMDFARAQAKAPTLALSHASLMSGAWVLATIGLIGRIGGGYHAIVPPPWWTIAFGGVVFLIMIAGAWCGGEMVYGHAIGVRDETAKGDLNGD